MFVVFFAGKWCASGGVGRYESVGDGLLEGCFEDVVGFVDGGGFVSFCDGADPGADGGGGEVVELCVAEVGLDEVVNVAVVACTGGGA